MQIENRVLLTLENQVALVQLNRPEKHNALDLEMFRAIAQMQQKLARARKKFDALRTRPAEPTYPR